TDWDSRAGRAVAARLSRTLALLPNVAEVRSLTQPLGTPLAIPTVKIQSKGVFRNLLQSVQKGIDGSVQQAERAARDYYGASLKSETGPRFVTRLDVVFHSDPFDAASMHTMELIQTWLREELPGAVRPLRDVRAECYGVTVNAHDLARVTEADRVRVNALVLGGIFLILLTLVRRIWLAAYLLVTVLFSYWVTLGATVLVGTLW